MHPSAMANAELFVKRYLDVSASLTILDVGSFNVNGVLRPLFVWDGASCTVCGRVSSGGGSCCGKEMKFRHACDGHSFRPVDLPDIGANWKYYGMDTRAACAPHGDMKDPLQAKRNVDIVADDEHRFPMGNNFADVVLSTSCLEHDPLFWVTFSEMVRVTKSGGLIYINVPSNGPYHGYPLDCWRFQQDAFKALSTWRPAARLLESYIDTTPLHGGWADNVGIFRVLKARE